MFIFDLGDAVGVFLFFVILIPVFIWIKWDGFKTSLKQNKCKHELYVMSSTTANAICENCHKDLGLFYELEEARKNET